MMNLKHVLSLLTYLLCLEMRASRHPGMHIAIDSQLLILS